MESFWEWLCRFHLRNSRSFEPLSSPIMVQTHNATPLAFNRLPCKTSPQNSKRRCHAWKSHVLANCHQKSLLIIYYFAECDAQNLNCTRVLCKDYLWALDSSAGLAWLQDRKGPAGMDCNNRLWCFGVEKQEVADARRKSLIMKRVPK